MSIEQLGRYRIDGKLGEGAMGVVYRAFDPLLERIVAIKTIRFDLGDQEDFERRFFREAKSAARLNHPAIVTVFDAGKVDDMAYIAMEFLEGRDLRQLLRSEPEGGQRLPYDRIAELIAAVADGLDYAHQAGVVHRDVKPANIIVLDGSANAGTVKLADFGIAQLQSSAKTMTGTMLGTPKYMAPEQIMGQSVDGRADIFSLGVVLYQLLTGTAPFDGETVSTIMYRVIHEGARRPSLVQGDVPPGFETILAKALAKKPEDRYASAAEMAADLRRYRQLHSAGAVGGLAEKAPAPLLDPEATIVVDRAAFAAAAPSKQPSTKQASTSSSGPASPTKPAQASKSPQATQSAPRWRAVAFLGLAILAAAGIAFALLSGRRAGSHSTEPGTAAVTPSVAGAAAVPVAAKNEIPAPATVELAVAPWGEVHVDGELKGIAPPLAELTLTSGHHEVEIRNAGFPSLVLNLDLAPGESRKLKHKFQ